MSAKFRDTFQSPYDDCGGVRCADLNGKPFTVKREYVDKAEDTGAEFDEPMVEIECDGHTVTAFAYEVQEEGA